LIKDTKKIESYLLDKKKRVFELEMGRKLQHIASPGEIVR
jgi:hypothetical protein